MGMLNNYYINYCMKLYVGYLVYVCLCSTQLIILLFLLLLFLIVAYQMLQRDGPVGQVMTSTQSMERIRCPVVGNPAPSEIFWQKGLARNDPK